MFPSARRSAALASLVFLSGAADAHSESTGSGLLAGLVHPLAGVDHLLAMVAVGIISVRMSRPGAIWKVPATFLLAMVAGAVCGYAGLFLPYAEAGIAASLIVLGAGIAVKLLPRRQRWMFAGVGLFGVFHGYAHGVELPAAAAPLFYSIGFLISSLFLHVCGIFIGEVSLGSAWRSALIRALGILMTLTGAWYLSSGAQLAG